MYNRPQLNNMFFVTVCSYLGVKDVAYVTTTAYHRMTNGQVESFNRSRVRCLRKYVGIHQRNWDLCIPTLTIAYNSQINRSTNKSPYSLVLSIHPIKPSIIRVDTANAEVLTTGTPPKEMRKRTKYCIIILRSKVDTHIRKYQTRYKCDYDRGVGSAPSIAVEQQFLHNKPLSEAKTTYDGTFLQYKRQQHTDTIDGHCIFSTVSIKWRAHVPTIATSNNISQINRLGNTHQS